MEEPGMESGIFDLAGLLNMRRFARPLTALIMALSVALPTLAESGPDEALGLIVSTRPEVLTADSIMVLSILVDHPRPDEVKVLIPDLPSSLALERVATLSRLVEGTSGQERWTAVELSLFLRSAGTILIPPIRIAVKGKDAATSPLELSVAGVLLTPGPLPSLSWRAVPERAEAGKPFTAELVCKGFALSAESETVVAVAENALVQSLGAAEGGTILRFRITPLAAGRLELPSVMVRTGNAEIRSPSLAIRAAEGISGPSRPASRPAVASGGASASGPKTPPKTARVDFESLPRSPSPSFLAKELASRLEPVRTAWNAGEGAYALAMLRAGERDSPAGFLLSETRRAAELELGIEGAGNEKYAPLILLVPLAFVSLAAFFFSSTLGGRGKRRRASVVALIALPLFLLSSTWSLLSRVDSAGFFGSGARVVLKACVSYRVPDEESGTGDEFSEGWPARVLSVADSWAYVETAKGLSGWIHRQNAVFY